MSLHSGPVFRRRQNFFQSFLQEGSVSLNQKLTEEGTVRTVSLKFKLKCYRWDEKEIRILFVRCFFSLWRVSLKLKRGASHVRKKRGARKRVGISFSSHLYNIVELLVKINGSYVIFQNWPLVKVTRSKSMPPWVGWEKQVKAGGEKTGHSSHLHPRGGEWILTWWP